MMYCCFILSCTLYNVQCTYYTEGHTNRDTVMTTCNSLIGSLNMAFYKKYVKETSFQYEAGTGHECKKKE